MLIGAFEVNESISGLREPVAIATLRPWLDAGSVGTLAIRRLQDALGAREVGALARPGNFFDFTRYRPTTRFEGDERVFTLPNTRLSVARRGPGPDLLFMDVMEPHARAEDYIDSLAEVLETAGVKAHWRIGAWFGGVPHTRPLRVNIATGTGQVDAKTRRPVSRATRYEGPTSIMNLLTTRLETAGIENKSLTLQIPQYVQIEEDFSAAAAMLEAAGEALGFAREVEQAVLGMRARGERQYEQLSRMVGGDSDMGRLVRQLEQAYDSEHAEPEPGVTPLSPEIEAFLGEVTRRIDSGDTDE